MAGRVGGPSPNQPEAPAGPRKRPQARRPRPAPSEPAGLPELFSPEFYARVNKGPLEEDYEAHNKDPKNWTPIPWGLVLVGILVGLVFSIVNAYAVLSVGITVAGSWFLLFFVGALLGWRPGVINYVGGSSTGASQVVIAIAFVLPALFFLSTSSGESGFYELDAIPSPVALVGFFLVGGLLGVLFFQVYRRLWVVDHPLPFPGAFESAGELLRMAQARIDGARSRIREHVFVVTTAALLTGFWVILRDLQVFGPADDRRSFLDDLFGGRFYSDGTIPAPGAFAVPYFGLITLQPFFLAIGWFVRIRIALILLLGSIVTFVLPFFSPQALASETPSFAFIMTWADNARLLAAATIVGAAVVALARLGRPIAAGFRELATERHTLEAARPLRFGLIVLALLLVAMAAFWASGVPLWGVLLVVPLGVLLIAVLGFATVKAAGETSVQPISPMIIIGLLALLLLLGFTGGSEAAILVLALGTAAFFGTGLLMSTDLFLDTKVGHYIGNPPHRQAIAQVAGLVPGVIAGTFVVWFLSRGIADGSVTGLTAPVGRTLEGLALLILGEDLPWLLILIAFLLGASVEYGTRLGTAFGIGMVLPLAMPVTLFAGAALREGYERFIVGEEATERASLWRLGVPVGVFIGASLTSVLVFGLHELI